MTKKLKDNLLLLDKLSSQCQQCQGDIDTSIEIFEQSVKVAEQCLEQLQQCKGKLIVLQDKVKDITND